MKPFDIMPEIKADAEQKINSHFMVISSLSVHLDAEHALKRQISEMIAADENYEPPQEFKDEANLIGISTGDLAKIVLAKPNNVMARGLERRSAIISVRNASTPEQVDSVLSKFQLG